MSVVELGAIGEFVGSIGVVATLAYLAIQVRMSNRFEAANHHDIHMDRIRANLRSLAENEGMARVWRIGFEGGDLDEDETTRWEAMAQLRILVQRDGWARGRILGPMPGLPEPTVYLDILANSLSESERFRSFWNAHEMRGVAWGREFVDYVDRRLGELVDNGPVMEPADIK